jgi:hypothetical protein
LYRYNEAHKAAVSGAGVAVEVGLEKLNPVDPLAFESARFQPLSL